MKEFLISIDTEGDNLWEWSVGNSITTENAKYLYRFQNLCNEYGFKPTYLTNYEMAISEDYQKFANKVLKNNQGEVGMHLHAWNTPPEHLFSNSSVSPGASYLIEYPKEIMENKISTMDRLLESVFDTPVITHRAGRWATNDLYFEILSNHGYKVDCSVTPYLNWSIYPGASFGSAGTDYSDYSENAYIVVGGKAQLVEVPLTVRKTHRWFPPTSISVKSYGHSVYRALKGQTVWLRPNGSNLNQMLWLVDEITADQTTDYIMFMLHSSEFLPGGSPTFRTNEDIEKLYSDLEILFKYASKHYEGNTIGAYGLSAISRAVDRERAL